MGEYENAEKDYMAGMKYKDIAEKYDVSINTVKSWKKGMPGTGKRVHTKMKKGAHKKCGIQKLHRCNQKTELWKHYKMTI